MAQAGASAFPRTPLPSAPAKSTITKVQIALNNLILHVTDALYIVAEAAPPVSASGEQPAEASQAADHEITQRAAQIAAIIAAVNGMIDELPDTSRTAEYYHKRIQELQEESVSLTNVLQDTVNKTEVLNGIVKQELKRLTADLTKPDTARR